MAYTSDFYYVSPYDGQGGAGWGIGEGTATGERLHGVVRWSNHPNGRGDGAMMPGVRGVILAEDDAVVMFSFSGRTVFVERPEGTVGRQLLMALFESEAEPYRWLNNTVCIVEGRIDPARMVAQMEVYQCEPEALAT